VQLGTNDTSVRRFARNVRAIVTIARHASARVLWVTIARPALHGTPAAPLNDVLRMQAVRHDTLQLIDWHAAVAAGRVQLTDGVHPTAAGYRVRAQLIANAVTSPPAVAAGACGAPVAPGALGELAGTPEQIVNRVVLYAHEHGFPNVTPGSVRAANDAHPALTSAGYPSDHKGPPDHAWAADISNAGSPTPQMDALAAAIHRV
jgi:hypothetical protein